MGSENSASTVQQLEQHSAKSTQDIVKAAITKKINDQEQQKKYLELLEQCLESEKGNRALGCLFGGFIGDALGSYCEFATGLDDQLISNVMKMPGGGVFNLKPGQFTDDSELAACLLSSLSKIDFSKTIPSQHFTLLRQISRSYVYWFDSHPFDIGVTCRKSILKLKKYQQQLKVLNQEQLKGCFPLIYKQIDTQNQKSQSNGSLMRIAPSATLFAFKGLSLAEHQQFIKDEVRLLHPNHLIQLSSTIWVNALANIINRQNDQQETFNNILKEVKKMDAEGHLSDWWAQAEGEHPMMATVNIGWAKIAWTYGMNLLFRMGNKNHSLNQVFYKKEIQKMISKGGDTDTNAAIVGSMLGAIVGFKNLPSIYIAKMMQLSFGNRVESKDFQSQNRPVTFEPFEVLKNSLEFIQKCSEIHDF